MRMLRGAPVCSSIAMTMKFLTPVRRTLSTHVASMPYVPSGVISALFETARAGVTVSI